MVNEMKVKRLIKEAIESVNEAIEEMSGLNAYAKATDSLREADEILHQVYRYSKDEAGRLV